MIKRAVIGPPARGYVDGRFIGEEKDGPDGRRGGRGKANADSILGSVNGAGAGRGGKRRGAGAGGAAPDNIGNTTAKRRGRGAPRGPNAPGGGQGQGQQGKRRGAQGQGQGQGQGAPRGRGGRPRPNAGQGTVDMLAPPSPAPRQRGPGGPGAGKPLARKGRGGKKTPFRAPPQIEMSPTQGADLRRMGDEAKSGQFAEALAASANIKRERLHKILAQSGHGSRRDMEILISSGRVMVNGIVATTGTQVAPGDNVLLDHRPIKLKFSEDLPRVLLYHKPEGEIVTTDDPGNRITVFDNLPRVETGKWVAIGRLDINTSGLLIFTTSGELANRFMHPRYEVEREYAVRILGELTEEQTQRLLDGVNIDGDSAASNVEEEDAEEFEFESDEFVDEFADSAGESIVPAPAAPAFQRSGLAKFDIIEKRGGEGVNHWYRVVIKEGRNREVRKMFESQGLQVSRLIRTRFGKVELPPRLMRGKMVELDPAQVRSVLASAGMKVEGATAPLSAGPRREGREGREPRGPGKVRGPRGRGAPRDSREAREPRAPREVDAGNRAPESAPFVANDGTVPVNKRRRNKRGPRGRDNTENRPDNRAPRIAGDATNAGSADVSGNGEGGNSQVPMAPGAPGTAARPAKGGRGRNRRNLRGRSRPPKTGGEAGGNAGAGGNDNIGNSTGGNSSGGNTGGGNGGGGSGGNGGNGGGEGFGNV